MTFMETTLTSGGATVSGMIVLPVDPTTAWILYATALALSCALVWLTGWTAEAGSSRTDANEPESRHVDDAA